MFIVASPALNSTAGGQPMFASTQWGILLAAAGEAESSGGVRAAWAELYRVYCYPIYAFIRRRGHSRPQAQDLTQDFFVHLLERETLCRADAAKGRFRSFLLGALEYFLIDVARQASARKRGGDAQFLFLDDSDAAETAYQLAAPVWETPERIFDARWAATLIDVAFARLHDEMVAAGKDGLFTGLKDYVVGGESAPYEDTAEKLGLTLSALKSIIHRLRRRYGMLLREEVARTVTDPADAEGELIHLRNTLRAG